MEIPCRYWHLGVVLGKFVDDLDALHICLGVKQKSVAARSISDFAKWIVFWGKSKPEI